MVYSLKPCLRLSNEAMAGNMNDILHAETMREPHKELDVTLCVADG